MRFETERTIIRTPEKKDALDIFGAYGQDPDVFRYLERRPQEHVADAVEWIDYCIANTDTPAGIILSVFHKEDRRAIGMVDFKIDGFKAELGYELGKAYWGKGIMTEAIKPVLAYIRELPAIYRIWAVHDIDNDASGKVIRKLGFDYEGILKSFIMHPNVSSTPRDVKMYAIAR